jgi:hypothetical protein
VHIDKLDGTTGSRSCPIATYSITDITSKTCMTLVSTGPNNGLEPTPSSLRYAAASRRGSGLVVLGRSIHTNNGMVS